MHRNPVILQISDLHFGTSVDPLHPGSSLNSQARDALVEGIINLRPLPDFIVATGDLANGGKPDEFRQARTFLDSLLARLWEEEHACRCIVIPGNHDVYRTTFMRPGGYIGRADRLTEFNAVFGGWSFLCPDVPAESAGHLLPAPLLDYYKTKFKGGDAELHAEKAAADAMRVCEHFPQFRIAFLKLDSNIRGHQWLPGHVARGRVGKEQRYAVDRILKAYADSTAAKDVRFSDARLITLVHHHVTRLPNVKLEEHMLLHDAGEVAQWLAGIGARFILHGHYHQADLMGLTYWTPVQNRKTDTIVISAGAATAKDAADGHNSCHYVKLGDFRTRVYRPNFDNGQVQPLDESKRFEFVHRPELAIDVDVPFISTLADSLAEAEPYADHDHEYEAIESVGYIDDDRAYWGTVLLKGTNITKYATHDLPYAFSAVGAQQFKEFGFRATDLLTQKRLPSPQLMEGRPVNLFPCRVIFDEPLEPKKPFSIQLTFVLRGVMLDEADYDMLNLVRFPKGVKRISIGLVADRKITGASLYELRGRRLVRSSLPVTKLSFSPRGGERARKGYHAETDTPLALSYMLFYKKLLPNGPAHA